MRIPLSAPDITEADIDAVVSVLRTTRLSIGPRMVDFEQSVAEFVGVPHAVAVSSGTAALHLCLRVLGIGEGDEVILPSFTFIAAGNVILYERAKPVFVDIDPVTLNLNPEKLEQSITPKTRAMIVVHTFGHPAAMEPILGIARKHGVPVIEDACEALGAESRGQKVGGIGDLGVFGFYPNKPITTGEGGMVVTRNSEWAETMRALRNQGRGTLLGYNYRLSEINCALGHAQMQRLRSVLDRREAIAKKYSKELSASAGIITPLLNIPDGRICWFVYVVRLPGADAICRQLTEQGIGCGRYFVPLHRRPLFTPYAHSDLKVTEQVAEQTLALPCFNHLTDDQIAEVCEKLGGAANSGRRRVSARREPA